MKDYNTLNPAGFSIFILAIMAYAKMKGL